MGKHGEMVAGKSEVQRETVAARGGGDQEWAEVDIDGHKAGGLGVQPQEGEGRACYVPPSPHPRKGGFQWQGGGDCGLGGSDPIAKNCGKIAENYGKLRENCGKIAMS